MALYGDLTHDSRVIREADTLATAGYAVTVYCLAGSPPPGARFEVVALRPRHASVLPDGSSPFLRPSHGSALARLWARISWTSGYARTVRAWGRAIVEAAGDVHVWHVHDLTGLLAVAPLVRRPCPLVYDSHEVFMETGTAARMPGLGRLALKAYERRLAKVAAAVVTVNDGTARVLRRRLRRDEVLVIRNCPPRWTPGVDDLFRLRAAAGIPADGVIALYHGGFSPNRGIEELAEALLESGMARVHAVLLGFGPTRDALLALAAEPRFSGRLHVLAAVPPGELLAWVAGADVAVMPVQHSTLNHWLGSPNKLWEALAAGVPVVVSNFPEMRRVVLEDPGAPLGGTCDPTSPAAIAAAIRAIVERPEADRAELKRRCLDAAHRRWNWETEGLVLTAMYQRLVGPGQADGGASARRGTSPGPVVGVR